MKTEEEIIKALEICSTINLCNNDCPYYGMHYGIRNSSNCRVTRMNDTLQLIRKQQAEIERLKCEMGKLLPKGCPYAMQMEVSNKFETQIRSEAIKEFWDRLKAQNSMDERIVSVKSGDKIMKEMVGEK